MTWRRVSLRVTFMVVGIVMASSLFDPRTGAAVTLGEPAQPGTLTAAQWQPWRDRFVTLDGRVIDTANNNISHSEGQGYGMLLAVLAEDRESFTRMWTFTRNELMLRDDGLAVWRWDPNGKPHVTDINDAADGDILIAYALALAGDLWKSPALTDAARTMAKAIGERLVKRIGDRTVLMPGAKGFSAQERPDGPVVNLSYWIFEALPVFARLVPNVDWQSLASEGLDLVREARFGSAELPADWISLRTQTPALAAGFDPRFGYDAVRIPLYLVRAGVTDPALLQPFAKAWEASGGAPPIVNLTTGQTVEDMNDPGYRMIGALMQCALGGKSIPPELRSPKFDVYFPATLYLLASAGVAQHYPRCL